MGPDILQLASAGDAKNVWRDMRVRSLYSPYYFIKVLLQYRALTKDLHYVELERFVDAYAAGHTLQWIRWPRGFFKTTCFTIGTAIWLVLPFEDEDTNYALDVLKLDDDRWFQRLQLHDQNLRQLLAFETIDNAKKKIGEIKWHFEANELFRVTFPEIAYTGSSAERPWNNQCLRIRRAETGSRHEEGTFEAIGVGGALQSRHYDLAWEDDLVGKDALESETVMYKTIRWHQLLHGAFVNAGKQVRFCVGNSWAYNDLFSHVQRNEPEFLIHTVCCTNTDEFGVEHPVFPVDGEGNERYTLRKLNLIREKMSKHDFYAQYYNRPIPEGETEVSLDKIHLYTVKEDGLMVCSCGAQWYPSQCRRYMHYDPYNAKGITSHSCPAIVVVGTSPDKHVFVLAYYYLKTDYNTVFSKIFSMNDAWLPDVFTYEDVGNQNMAEFHIRNQMQQPAWKEKHKPFHRITAVKTGGTSHENRIRHRLFPYVEAGQLALRDVHTYLLNMFETFPNKMPDHDYDLLDALEDGADMWTFPMAEDHVKESQSDEQKAAALGLGKPYSYVGGHA